MSSHNPSKNSVRSTSSPACLEKPSSSGQRNDFDKPENVERLDNDDDNGETGETSGTLNKPPFEVPKEFFKYVGETAKKGNSYSRCLKCNGTYSCYNRSRENLKSHIKAKHMGCYAKFQAIIATLPTGKKRVEVGVDNSSCLSISSFFQPNLKTMFSKVDKRNITQEEVYRKILEAIVNGVLPLALPETEWFQELLKWALGDEVMQRLKMPSQFEVTSRLKIIYEEKKEKLISVLKNVRYVCTTADAWSSRHKGFLRSTVHWINPIDMTCHSACLGLRRISECHTYSVLAENLDILNGDFGIMGKITCTVTDNASKFVKAFVIFGEDSAQASTLPSSKQSSSSASSGTAGKPSNRRETAEPRADDSAETSFDEEGPLFEEI